VFAITPHGDVIDLPAGATPVDFAYHIHSEIGDSCVSAKVNGQIVPLSHQLQSGDLVEIITQKNKKPSEDWLEFAVSAAARDHIRAGLRKKRETLAPKRQPMKAELRIVAVDRIGLLKDITMVIARSHVNIVTMNAAPNPGSKMLSDRILVATADKDKLEKLCAKLRKISGIKTVSYQLIV
jgi:(p)ppGpp synthase/HD superfamily hydrolase